MSKNPSNESLKLHAILSLEQSRAAMGAELRSAREQLAPSRVVHRLVDRHPRAVLVSALIAGFAIPQFFFRRTRTVTITAPQSGSSATATAKSWSIKSLILKSLWKAVRAPLLGLATQQLTPLIMPLITKYFTQRPHSHGSDAAGYRQAQQ